MPSRLMLLAALALATAIGTARPAAAATGGIPLVNFDMELPGPPGQKVVAFEEDGTPIPGIIPGWTFTGGAGGVGEVPGLGNEDFGGVLGDSGTEGSGFAEQGQEMLLSTNDGRAYQIAPGHTIINPDPNQQYKISFEAFNIFTIDENVVGVDDGFQLSARVFAGAYPGTTLKTLDVSPGGGFELFEILIPRDDPVLTGGVLGQSLGIEFDTTSREFNANVAKSWAGIDNVVMEITGLLPGDLNGDGVVDLSDSANLITNLQASTPFEADGELTGDNVVDLNDFRALKSLISAAALSGPGSVTAAGLSAPEPSSAWLVLIMACFAATAFAARRRPQMLARPVAVGAVALGAVLSMQQSSQAELLAYDPFLIGTNPAAGEYFESTEAGDPPVISNPLAGQNPTIGPDTFFTGPWIIGSEGQTVQSAGLSYLGTPSMGGSATGFGRTTRRLTEQWTDSTEGTFYISVQMNFGDTPDENMGYRALEFYPPDVIPAENRVGDIGYNQFFSSLGPDQQAPDTAQMQFNLMGAAQQLITAAPASFNDDGLNHLLVLKFELSATAGEDRVSLYFDPKTTIEPIAANNVAEDFDFVLGSFGLASFGGSGATTVLDEIRVGSLFEDVLPPDLPVPGDVNGDKLVDILDYNIIFANMNMPGGQSLAQGDVDGDGRVTISDYRFWKSRRTDLTGALSGGLQIPEPASAGLLLITLISAGSASLRRRV